MHLLVLGGTRDARRRAARAAANGAAILRLDTDTLPFQRAEFVTLPAAPRVLLLEDIERAFPDAQRGGTRLVLTQSTYLLQKWIDRLDEGDRIIATADRAALERCAPEAFHGRGPWRAFEIREQGSEIGDRDSASREPLAPRPFPVAALLASALSNPETSERLRLCRDAASLDAECEVAQLALASACRENRDGAGARAALDRAASLAPDWEAVAFESGKLSLVYDDMTRARDAFQRAADLMPSFSAAFSNLGATLGELGDPASALRAFRQALGFDPRGFTILNNIGVVSRELGRLDESADAFREVIAIDPGFVFGHYNLGHTLFLMERYADAVAAYEEGQRRDPQHNRRQGCRLAVARFATGDIEGAGRDLWRLADAAPPGERDDLLLEAYEIVRALLTRQPALAPQQAFLDRLGAEIIKSE